MTNKISVTVSLARDVNFSVPGIHRAAEIFIGILKSPLVRNLALVSQLVCNRSIDSCTKSKGFYSTFKFDFPFALSKKPPI